MTPKFRSLRLTALIIAAFIFFAAPASHAASRRAAKPSKSSGKRGRGEAASRKDSRGSKRERAADRRREDRRSRRDERASKESRKDTRSMSKRERMLEARREAERRRREAAEAARRAAIARAIALARQRAADQALKDETAANIAKDETVGEDPEVRRVAVQALGDRAGTVVVMNPKTGQVYTVVNQEWGLRRGFKPCSTTKLVTGLAGLTEHVIDPVQTVNIGTSTYALDLTDSLAFSNNGYFQRVGGQVGFTKMMDYARKLGLGQQTGINFPLESPGRLPSFKEGYAVNHMSSHGDDIEVTALQLANIASAIGNGGHLLVPHMPRTPVEAVNFKREVKRDLDIPQENYQRMIPGMIGAVNYGTAKRAYNPLETIAGKTGTCTGQGSKLGLFTSFGPVHDPTLAVAVILRNSHTGGKYAAEVAGQVYRGLQSRFGIRPGTQPMLANDPLAPRPHIDPRKADEVSDEDKDDDADSAAAGATATQAGTQQGGAAQPALQKTAKTVERPQSGAPARTNNYVAPTPTAPAQKTTQGAERPRRVSDRPQE
jgi:penicillin-binding protein 2